MPAIDFSKPLRIKATGTRLYAGWHCQNFRGTMWVALRPDPKRSGFRYDRAGEPVDEGCPWGAIENFEEESPFETIEYVRPEDAFNPEALARKRKREHDAMLEELGECELWAMF